MEGLRGLRKASDGLREPKKAEEEGKALYIHFFFIIVIAFLGSGLEGDNVL